MYDTPGTHTATIELTPRQWTRVLLDPCCVLSQRTTSYVLFLLPSSDGYPTDLIPISTTPREAAFIVALIRDYQERG